MQIFNVIQFLFTTLEFSLCPVCVYITFVFIIIFMIHVDCYLVLTFLEIKIFSSNHLKNILNKTSGYI